MSLKTDKLIELANNALNDDKCVVIGLQTTGEAESTRDTQKIRDDLISAPALTAERFVRNIFFSSISC